MYHVNYKHNQDLEKRLVETVEAFITDTVNKCLEPLISFLTKASAFINVRTGQQGSSKQLVSEQPFGLPGELKSHLSSSSAQTTLSVLFINPSTAYIGAERLVEILSSVHETVTTIMPPIISKIVAYLDTPDSSHVSSLLNALQVELLDFCLGLPSLLNSKLTGNPLMKWIKY